MSDEFVPYLKGPQDARQHQIYNLPTPVDPDQATNKAYVDGRTSGGGGSSVTLGVPSLTLSTTNAIGTSTSAVASNATVAVFDTTAPVTQLFGDAAATGSAAVAARRDHVHGIPANPVTYATPSIQLSTAAAAGTSTSLIRSDSTILAFDTTVPVVQAIGDSAAAGSAAVAARRDHTHGMPGFAAPAFTLSTANSIGTTTSLVRSNAQIAIFDTTVPTTQAFGDAAAVGTAAFAARRDHSHGIPANPVLLATPAIVFGSSAAAGSSASLIRSDATVAAFDTTAPTTQAFSDAAAVGTAAFAARRDHKHAMMADPTGGNPWTRVQKLVDTSIASSVALTVDPEVSFTASSAGVYHFQFLIIYGSPAGGGTPDIRIAFAEDATARGINDGLGWSTTDANTLQSQGTTNSGGGILFGTAAANRMILGRGHHLGNGGAFNFYWAQGTSGSNPTIVRTATALWYRRIV